MEGLRRILSGNKQQQQPCGLMSASPSPLPPAPRDSPPKSAAGALQTAHSPPMPLTQSPKRSLTEGFVSRSQRDSVPYRLKPGTAERFRRHSVDGSSLGQEGGPGDVKRFHPYGRRCSDGVPPAGLPYRYLRECPASDALSPALMGTTQAVGPAPWAPHSMRAQPSVFMEQSLTEELRHYTPSDPGVHSTVSSLPHQFPDDFSPVGPEVSSFYSFQSASSRSCEDSPAQLYPKPVYSYSILIFMALRNSRTGTLPVSEIYSFMTEHFPYFKTAPDGWKNSVRHNLSLNKCFEKVENKISSSARKGCLWALNPAKVEKMQEELRKWRRKDPLTVRRSMARPEELDYLLGERSEKLKTFSVHLTHPPHPQFHRASPAPSCRPAAPLRRAQHGLLASPGAAHSHLLLPSNPQPFPFYPPITQQPSTHLPPCTGSLDSPLPAHTPPSYSAALQTNHGTAGSLQELLMEAEMSSDIDTLNPSLTDLQLHGHLWEELRNDSLAPDALVLVTTSDAPGELAACQAGTDAGLQTAFPDLHVSALQPSGYSEAALQTAQEHPTLPLL